MNSSQSFITQEPIVVLIGPTAIGKTALSIQLAHEFDFEIISVDSMQVYRYMNIGTAKITKDEMENIPHHLIDVVYPDDSFDAACFEKLALAAIQDIHSRGKRVLLTGGTGLYLRALVEGLSKQIPDFPEIRKEIEAELKEKGAQVLHEQLDSFDRISAKRIHANDSHRLVRAIEIYKGTGKPWSTFIAEHQASKNVRFPNILNIGLTCEREKLYQRIGQRSNHMLKSGFREEVEGLLEAGYRQNLKSMQSIGYSHMVKWITGEWGQQEMLDNMSRDTRRYAKRQYTWFNKIKDLEWVKTEDSSKIRGRMESFIDKAIRQPGGLF